MQARELRAQRMHEVCAFENALSGLAAFLAADTLRREEKKEKLARGLTKEVLLPSWSWVCRELVLLLQQYPGGISKAVAYTHALERSTSTRAERKAASRRTRLPGSALLPISAVRGVSERAIIFSIEAVVASSGQQQGRPPLMVLQDLDKPDICIEAYIHSQLEHLLQGGCTILQAGRKLRMGGCALYKSLDGLHARLLPSVAVAFLVSSPQEAQELLQRPLCSLSQVVAASGKAGVVDGILHAVVATVPATAEVAEEDRACIWLDDPFAALPSGPVPLRLSNQQADFAGLMAPGEHMLLTCPAICKSPSAGLLQMSEESIVCVNSSIASCLDADKENQCKDDVGKRAEERRPLIAALQPGSTDVALIGSVVSMDMQSVGCSRALHLVLEDESGTTHVQMTDLSQSLRAIYACRPGHTVVIAGIYTNADSHATVLMEEGDSVTPLAACLWSEARPGSIFQSLTALPALLASPLFHRSPALLPSLPLQPARPVLCDVCLAASPIITVRRVHAMCGRALTRASMGLADLFGDPGNTGDDGQPAKRLKGSNGESIARDDRPSTSQQGCKGDIASMHAYQSEEGAGLLWTCSFCGIECAAQGTQPDLSARMELTDAAGNKAEAVASGSVVCDLIHMPPLAFLSLTVDEQSKALQELAGRPLRVSLYQLPCSAEDNNASEPLTLGMLKWES